jgi:hypothetical protein
MWRVVRVETLVGEPILEAKRLNVVPGPVVQNDRQASWALRGITSNERYVVREEKDELAAKQLGLGRPDATCATLIPIRKNAARWSLSQDQWQRVFEEQSRHAAMTSNP